MFPRTSGNFSVAAEDMLSICCVNELFTYYLQFKDWLLFLQAVIIFQYDNPSVVGSRDKNLACKCSCFSMILKTLQHNDLSLSQREKTHGHLIFIVIDSYNIKINLIVNRAKEHNTTLCHTKRHNTIVCLKLNFTCRCPEI